MILYQLAKWMEERTRLHKSIKESKGDVSFLLYKKEQVEEQMLYQAHKWFGSSQELQLNPLMEDVPLEEPEQGFVQSNV